MLSQTIHTGIPSIFFVSKKVIRKQLFRMYKVEIFTLLVLVFCFFYFSSKVFILLLISQSPAMVRSILTTIFWRKKYRKVDERMPYISIEDNYIQHVDTKHFAKIQIANIAGIELKKVFLGPKYLEIRFKERVIDDRSLIPAHHKWMHWSWIRGDDQIKCRWSFLNTADQPEYILNCLNFHLDEYSSKP